MYVVVLHHGILEQRPSIQQRHPHSEKDDKGCSGSDMNPHLLAEIVILVASLSSVVLKVDNDIHEREVRVSYKLVVQVMVACEGRMNRFKWTGMLIIAGRPKL